MVGGVREEGEEEHQVFVESFGGRAQGRHHMVEDRKVLHGLPSDFLRQDDPQFHMLIAMTALKEKHKW